MRLLVTAGNTQVQIDRVRSITNIFTGKTGGRIALVAHAAGHSVTLLTSRSCARVSASLSDLRGKVRFALARVGWEL